MPGELDQAIPVFTNRCCRLVSDHVSIRFGSTRIKHASEVTRDLWNATFRKSLNVN